uniref:CSON007985 protein n=1 Tax=Culicoides sonorensis TaxID=179676 RepID=A0A336M0Y4_CULSO
MEEFNSSSDDSEKENYCESVKYGSENSSGGYEMIQADLNKTMRASEFELQDMESDFEKAASRQNVGFKKVTDTPWLSMDSKKVENTHELPDYDQLLVDELRQLRLCEEKIKRGEMKMTKELRRKFTAAFISVSPNSSNSSGDDSWLQISPNTKKILDTEGCKPDTSFSAFCLIRIFNPKMYGKH